jgi:phosphoglucosamine mutase
VIGKDTRISGDMLQSALVSGICSVGGSAYLAGTLPTPAVALLTSSANADAGIVISASHNPFYDNGIKLFNRDGYKLSEAMELEIEKIIFNHPFESVCESVQELGNVQVIKDAKERYLDFLKRCLPASLSFSGMRIVIDCANGAASQIAPQLFCDLGAHVYALSNTPNGININDDCGSQFTKNLKKTVIKTSAHIGLAFDGDADRLIAVDENGSEITGDQILAVCAHYLKQKGKLKNNRVVSTVMSNMGFISALKRLGIRYSATNVGDRHVLEKMVTTGAVVGGEDSGHMIFLDHHTTGDGLLAAIKLLEAIVQQGKPLSALAKIMTVFPQVLLGVEVGHKPDLAKEKEICEVIASVERSLGADGRVLVRYSGTQPICRVMVEGPTAEVTKSYCRQIADVVDQRLGKG